MSGEPTRRMEVLQTHNGVWVPAETRGYLPLARRPTEALMASGVKLDKSPLLSMWVTSV